MVKNQKILRGLFQYDMYMTLIHVICGNICQLKIKIKEMIKMAKDLIIRSSTEEFITFKLQEKDKGIQVKYENETLWMTQKAIAELFDVQRPAITKHLKIRN